MPDLRSSRAILSRVSRIYKRDSTGRKWHVTRLPPIYLQRTPVMTFRLLAYIGTNANEFVLSDFEQGAKAARIAEAA